MNKPFIVQTISSDENGISVFSEMPFDINQHGGMFLTDQIASKNFRIRKSNRSYETDFHLAGDATFIVIVKGSLKIELQNGDYKIFSGGDYFIAKDSLPDHITFDRTIHGHKASVVGEELLEAIHIKL